MLKNNHTYETENFETVADILDTTNKVICTTLWVQVRPIPNVF